MSGWRESVKVGKAKKFNEWYKVTDHPGLHRCNQYATYYMQINASQEGSTCTAVSLQVAAALNDIAAAPQGEPDHPVYFSKVRMTPLSLL